MTKMNVVYVLLFCVVLGVTVLVLVQVQETRTVTHMIPPRFKDHRVTVGFQATVTKGPQDTDKDMINNSQETQLHEDKIKSKPNAPECKYCVNPENYEVLIAPFNFKVERRKVDVVLMIPSRNDWDGFEQRMAI